MQWPTYLPHPTAYQIKPVDELIDDGERLDALFCHEQMLAYVYTPVIKIYLDRMLQDLAQVPTHPSTGINVFISKVPRRRLG